MLHDPASILPLLRPPAFLPRPRFQPFLHLLLCPPWPLPFPFGRFLSTISELEIELLWSVALNPARLSFISASTWLKSAKTLSFLPLLWPPPLALLPCHLGSPLSFAPPSLPVHLVCLFFLPLSFWRLLWPLLLPTISHLPDSWGEIFNAWKNLDSKDCKSTQIKGELSYLWYLGAVVTQTWCLKTFFSGIDIKCPIWGRSKAAKDWASQTLICLENYYRKIIYLVTSIVKTKTNMQGIVGQTLVTYVLNSSWKGAQIVNCMKQHKETDFSRFIAYAMV